MVGKNNQAIKKANTPAAFWDVTPSQAIRIQQEMRKLVKIEKLQRKVKTIGGSDISFNIDSNIAYAVFVVLDFNNLNEIERSYYVGELKFPYIPGLLSFTEIPLLLEAWNRLKHKPDVVMFDGHGIAHPRHLGIASHFGVLTQTPTLGCAKSRLVGLYKEPESQANSYSPLFYKDEIIGAVYRTRTNVSPIFASPGHLMDLSDVIQILKSLNSKFRIPAPTRQAHFFANSIRQNFSNSNPIKIFRPVHFNCKEPFRVEKALSKIKKAVQPFPKATLFELADRGFTT